jgi:nucleotide-binding universal stress UspA family protein
MNTPKYKLLVLTDLSKASEKVLDNAVNLSKMINGSIDLFHVLKPADIVESENPLLAMYTIDEESYKVKSKLKKLVREISKREDIKVNASFRLGNLKSEVLDQIEAINPDIIVLGKQTSRFMSFLGGGFTKFILKNFNGSVLISGKEKIMSPSEAMSIGLFNTTGDELSLELTKDLQKRIKNPIKQFQMHSALEKNIEKEKNVITYEFENGTQTIDTIATYVAKNNIGLLCMNQHPQKSTRIQDFKSNVIEAIHKINVPILILRNKSTVQLQ